MGPRSHSNGSTGKLFVNHCVCYCNEIIHLVTLKVNLSFKERHNRSSTNLLLKTSSSYRADEKYGLFLNQCCWKYQGKKVFKIFISVKLKESIHNIYDT